MKNLFNHTEENPLIVDNYPYGFKLRTQIKYWIETDKKKGDRFCSQTLNPKNNRWNAPKKGTYSPILVMYLDEKNHVQNKGISIYSEKSKIQAFIDEIGIENLNPMQLDTFNSLMGFNKPIIDEFSGKKKKDFSIKWEKGYNSEEVHELKITFDRPDGVSIREIFEAMRTVNQEKLMQMFEGWDSKMFGHVDGFVRVCVRGGVQLTTVKKDAYNEYLASDDVVNAMESKITSDFYQTSKDF